MLDLSVMTRWISLYVHSFKRGSSLKFSGGDFDSSQSLEFK